MRVAWPTILPCTCHDLGCRCSHGPAECDGTAIARPVMDNDIRRQIGVKSGLCDRCRVDWDARRIIRVALAEEAREAERIRAMAPRGSRIVKVYG